MGIDDTEFVIADIPGLIEGAHEGKGIGDRFLGHVERCAVLLHLVDGTADDVAGDYRTIIHELEAYGGHLADKPRVTVLNKIDALDGELVEMQLGALSAVADGPVLTMSGVSRAGVDEVLRTLRPHVDRARGLTADEDEGTGTWMP